MREPVKQEAAKINLTHSRPKKERPEINRGLKPLIIKVMEKTLQHLHPVKIKHNWRRKPVKKPTFVGKIRKISGGQKEFMANHPKNKNKRSESYWNKRAIGLLFYHKRNLDISA